MNIVAVIPQDLSTTASPTFAGLNLGDNAPINIGIGGLTGALGSDGKIYSDGTITILQIESPSGSFSTKNPKLGFGYYDLIAGATNLYVPVIKLNYGDAVFPNVGILQSVLYVQDTDGTTDGGIFIPDEDFPFTDDYFSCGFASATHTATIATVGSNSPYLIFNIAGSRIDFTAATNTDFVFNFIGTTNSGVITWMEDEDYFKFGDDLFMDSAEQIILRDANSYIYSSDSGKLDLVATSEIRIVQKTADQDVTLRFVGTTNEGVLNWFEDEDYFRFFDDVLMASTERIYFNDTDVYISSINDGYLDLTADSGVRINTSLTIGSTSTDDISCVGRLRPRDLNGDPTAGGGMAGTRGEICYDNTNEKIWLKTVDTGTNTNWVALN